ncbi:MAG: hypothetical protein ABR570_07960 [Burkholderiales bacterium]
MQKHGSNAATNDTNDAMNPRLRQERTTFLLFLGALYVSLMAALPIATASLSQSRYASDTRAATQPTFEALDRNGDGYVDRHEAERLPGLEAIFDAADHRADGRLDKVEYAKALAMLDAEGRP